MWFEPLNSFALMISESLGVDVLWVEFAATATICIVALWAASLCVKLLKPSGKNRSVAEVAATEPKRGKGSPLADALLNVRSGFIGVAFFSFWINLLMLVAPLYMLQVYDRVLTSRSYDTLIFLTILAVTLLALNGFLELVRSRVLVRIGGKLDERLGDDAFRSLFQFRPDRRSSGTQTLSDLAQVRNFLSGSGPNAFFDAPWTPIFIALIFVFHPVLGFIALGGAVALFAIAIVSEFATRKTSAVASQKSRSAIQFADASVRNTEVINGMGMVPQLSERWLERNRDSLAYQGLANDRIGMLTALSKFIRPSLQIAILGAGAYLVLQEATTPGVMIAASIIMGRALAPVEAAVGQWRAFVAARAAYGRLKEVFGGENTSAERISLPRPSGNLDVQSLTLVPPGAERPILDDVSFRVAAGSVLAVIGPSAAGKSTLARALVGVWPPTDGKVRLDGADLQQWIPEELGQYIGYLPQDVELFEGSVAENISRFQEIDSKRVIEAAKLAGAHEMILQFPDGYSTEIGPQGSVLSGGQRQRLGLARALYGDPPLIVLDEPNASLDSSGEKALMLTIQELRERGQTVIVISHRSSILTAVDYVLILNGGRVEAFDEREKLLPKLVGPAQPIRAIPKKPPAKPAQKEAAVAGASKAEGSVNNDSEKDNAATNK
ncbi:MAG: type I secretion system permease/ATPase [Pseudomonadota bacterium]